MKLYIDDSGDVICDAGEINESFWSRVRFKYFYFTDKGIRRAKVEAANYIFSDYHEAGRNYFTLKAIVDEAERYGVDVAPGIKSRLSELEKLWRNMYEDEQKRLDEQKKKERWEVLRSIGCGTCQNLVKAGDGDFVCKASGDYLDYRNRPKYDGENVYRIINFVPFPSENCPEKA